MKIIAVSAGHLHCDGGALFGVVPKVLWNKEYPANEQNFTPLTMRCLLIDLGKQKILIETGVGNHYPEKYLKNNGIIPGNHLEKSLTENGYSPADITDVLFTHLHWDHCTGAVKKEDDKLQLTFPNASLWCSQTQWEHTQVSNKRERAAYHNEVLGYMQQSGKLNLVKKEGELFKNIEVRIFNGHTPGLLIPFIHYNKKTFVYTSDLIPTAANIPLLWIAAYDLYPVKVMDEKETFLNEVVAKKHILLFEHDYYTECAGVEKWGETFRLNQKYLLTDLI